MPRNFSNWYRTPITSMSAARGIWWRAIATTTSPPPSFPSSDGCRRRRDFRPVGRKLIPPASSRPALSQRRMQRKMELGMQAEQVALAPYCASALFLEKGRPKTLALRNCKPLSGYKPAELSANKISGPRHAVGRRDTECPPASWRGEVVHHRVAGVAPAASPPVALARIPGPGAKPTGRRSGRDCCNANSGRCERGNHQFAHHKSSPCTLRVQTNHGLA